MIGDREGAASFYPLVREYMETTNTVLLVLLLGLVERIAGISATAGGQWDLAEGHFQTALRQAEELPLRGARGRDRAAATPRCSSVGTPPGDRNRARSLVDEALIVYRRVGMPRHEELALRLITT